MSIDEYIKREEALRDAKKHLLGGIDENLRHIALGDMPIGMQPNLPLMPPTPRHLTKKGYSVSQLKSMTEDELLAEICDTANPTDAQMITAALIIKRTKPQGPHWTTVYGFWAVIVGIVVTIAIALFSRYC